MLYEEYILAQLDPASCFWVEPAKVKHNILMTIRSLSTCSKGISLLTPKKIEKVAQASGEKAYASQIKASFL